MVTEKACSLITSGSAMGMRKWNKLSQFRWKSTKANPKEKTQTEYILAISKRFKRGGEWITNSLTDEFL